jgi:aldehyde:ferredoxin oxidoreductase
LQAVGNRVITESHQFNERRGFGAKQERLPAWLTERATDDEAALRVTQDEIETMQRDYYALRGWGAPPA